MKIYCASAFSWQCFCWGRQDFILTASVFTSAISGKTSTRSKVVGSIMCKIVVVQILYAMQCALFPRQNLCFKNNFGCFI